MSNKTRQFNLHFPIIEFEKVGARYRTSSRFYQTSNYFTRPNILWHVIIKNMAATWKKDKIWVIKTILINDLRFYMSFCTKYGCYDRFFHLMIFSFLPDQFRFYQSGPTVLQSLGKTAIMRWVPLEHSHASVKGIKFLKLFLNNFLGLLTLLKVVFGSFPFVDLTCSSCFNIYILNLDYFFIINTSPQTSTTTDFTGQCIFSQTVLAHSQLINLGQQ